jgi:hypothetical protein
VAAVVKVAVRDADPAAAAPGRGLWVHDRKRALDALPSGEVRALTSVFSAFADTPSENDRSIATRVLERLHAARHWLQCQCPALPAPGPLIFPRRRETGRIELVRQHGTSHDEGCPLRQVRVSVSTPREAVEAADAGRYFQGFSGFATTLGTPRVAAEDAVDEDSVEVTQRPKELRLLLRAWHEAGYDQLNPNDLRWSPRGEDLWVPGPRDLHAHYGELQRRVAPLEIEPGLMVGDLTAWQPKAVPWIVARLARGVHRFSCVRPQGFFLGVVHDATAHELIRERGSEREVIPVVRPILRSGRETSGPYAAIALIGQASQDDGFAVQSAGIWPVLSRSLLLPVDSGYERSTALILLQVQSWLNRRHHLDVRLIKPLFDTPVGTARVRPDFILELHTGKQVLVETMGSDDADYLARKERTHRHMTTLPHVVALVPHWPTQDTERALFSRVSAALLKAAGRSGS